MVPFVVSLIGPLCWGPDIETRLVWQERAGGALGRLRLCRGQGAAPAVALSAGAAPAGGGGTQQQWQALAADGHHVQGRSLSHATVREKNEVRPHQLARARTSGQPCLPARQARKQHRTLTSCDGDQGRLVAVGLVLHRAARMGQALTAALGPGRLTRKRAPCPCPSPVSTQQAGVPRTHFHSMALRSHSASTKNKTAAAEKHYQTTNTRCTQVPS